MAQVLFIYKQVELLRAQTDRLNAPLTAFISYDEKPGIQAIANTAPDLCPAPGRHAIVGRAY